MMMIDNRRGEDDQARVRGVKKTDGFRKVVPVPVLCVRPRQICTSARKERS